VGTWTDPALSATTFGDLAERWISTKANRSPKTVAGYRSILDTIVLPRWKELPLRDFRYDDLQVWVTSLSVDGSTRFEGKGLSASRVRQTHQLIGAVLKFAVRAKHLAANPADGIDLPPLPETEQRLTHKQLQSVAVASGHLRRYATTRTARQGARSRPSHSSIDSRIEASLAMAALDQAVDQKQMSLIMGMIPVGVV
jgi:hypothetical protein